MTEPWHLATLAVAMTIFATACIAHWRHWINRRTFVTLWAVSATLNCLRHLEQGRHGWATADAAVVLLMAWLWWSARPPHTTRNSQP